MTNEEILQTFSDINHAYNNSTKYDTLKRMLDELTEPCGDCISREDAIRWVKTECNPYGKPTLDFESGKKVIEHLEQMPSAQPEPKTGRWLDTYNDGDWHCSECGAIVEKDEQIRHYWQRCYHCGARMGR